MKPKSFALIFFAAFLLAACASPATELVGTSWVLQTLDGNGQVGRAVSGQPVTLQFTSATEMGGFGGCNSYGGSYQASGGRIRFSNIVSTLMACADEEFTNLESAYVQALGVATAYTVVWCESCANAGTLTITGGGHTLVFVSP